MFQKLVGVVPAARLSPSLLLLAGLRRFLAAFFLLELLADELSHLLSLLRVVLFIRVLVVFDVAFDFFVRLEENINLPSEKIDCRSFRSIFNVTSVILPQLRLLMPASSFSC